MDRDQFSEEHEAFRARVREFIRNQVLPNYPGWRRKGVIDRWLFAEAGRWGMLGLDVPAAFGGRGLFDYRFSQVMLEEFETAGVGSCGTGLMLQNDVIMPYLLRYGSDEQKDGFLRPLCAGEAIGALAITEPGAGSDVAGISTRAERDGSGYRISGTKTYIGCGINADFVLTVAQTDPEARHHGLTVFVVEADREGFARAANLDRAGREPQDVAELQFDDVWVPTENLLGEEGRAFSYLMDNLPRERLQVAASAIGACTYMLALTVAHVKDRQMFGTSLGTLQHTRFTLAELATELHMARAFVDKCVLALAEARLTTAEASMAKWWCSEMQVRFADRCFQLHGAKGYMHDSAMSRAWKDARITTVYAGTTEVMKEIVGKSLGL